MSKHIIFSIAFIFTLCLFWMQIQTGRCADELDVWVATTKPEPNERAGGAYYETENKDAPRRHNMKYQINLNRTSLESNQVNELDEMVNDQTGTGTSTSDSPLYMSVPDKKWFQKKRKHPKEILRTIISSHEKVTQTVESKENHKHRRPITPVTKHKKRIVNGQRTTKRRRTHAPTQGKHNVENEKRAQNKKLREKHNSERTINFNNDERTMQLENTPPIQRINEPSKETLNSDAESEVTDNPESVDETEKPFRIDLAISPNVKAEFGSRENKNLHHISNKQQARSGKKKISKKTTKTKASTKKSANSVTSLKYLAPHSIKRQLRCIAKSFDTKAIIDQEVIGRTVEYNDIILWKIRELPDNRKRFKHKTFRNRGLRGSKYADEKPEKKIVFIVHGLNIMGWHKLKCLSEVKSFQTLLGFYLDNLDCFDIYLIPMANPDGVQISARQGYWNKNVSPQKACPGVNLDRNFDVGWNTSYAKTSSCSQQYPGPRALSEHETKAIREVFNQHGHKMAAFFHVHSSTYDTATFRGDAVLYPKGYTDAQTDDDKYVDFKGELDEAMRNTSFKVLGVTVDTLHSWYGKVIGTSVDYASTIFGIPFAFDFSMQIYDDDTMVTKEEDREQNTALVELWQIVIDIAFSHIHNSTDKNDQ